MLPGRDLRREPTDIGGCGSHGISTKETPATAAAAASVTRGKAAAS